MNYKTPGVYVEEISTLPPSVAEVATAIPAFIGNTAAGPAGEVVVAQISTMLEYEERFGTTQPTDFTLDADGGLAPASSAPAFMLWYAMQLYFKNGGGRCYVISVDDQSSAPSKERLLKGLAALEREDEPTLIVIPEAVTLPAADFQEVCQETLKQCDKLGDRFAIFDVKPDAAVSEDGGVADPGEDEDPPEDGGVAGSRLAYGADNLSYGAAYHPWLMTTLSHRYEYVEGGAVKTSVTVGTQKLEDLKAEDTALYNQAKKTLGAQRVTLPPSAAVAGVYARVDRDRGVWKAPANVGVAAALAPTLRISDDEQEALNVVPGSGKSINALRAFAGKGTLVWGARTLAGNDNEWRYVPVRRLFIMIEESTAKASAFAVFEPNDATTWLKVRGMIESYLYGLWERGALQGSTPEQAYYVHVGLGKTMTAQDILEGRLIVEIGVAAVRPAEFIILRFSHKLAEA